MHTELLAAAEVLAHKALGKDLRESIRHAVLEGRQASEQVAGSKMDVVRVDWPTGMGYEIEVSIS